MSSRSQPCGGQESANPKLGSDKVCPRDWRRSLWLGCSGKRIEMWVGPQHRGLCKLREDGYPWRSSFLKNIRYDLYSIKFTQFNRSIKCFLANLCCHATITTIQFKNIFIFSKDPSCCFAIIPHFHCQLFTTTHLGHNFSSTFCLYRFAFTGSFMWKESYHMQGFAFGFFHEFLRFTPLVPVSVLNFSLFEEGGGSWVVVVHCIDRPSFVSPFTSWCTLWLFLVLGYYK